MTAAKAIQGRVTVPYDVVIELLGVIYALWQFECHVRNDGVDSEAGGWMATQMDRLSRQIFGDPGEDGDFERWAPEVAYWARGSELEADLYECHVKGELENLGYELEPIVERAAAARVYAADVRQAGCLSPGKSDA